MTKLQHRGTRNTEGLTRRLTACAAVASLVYAVPAGAAEDTTLGHEFLDMPEEEPAEGEAPPPEPEDEREAPGYVPGYRQQTSVGLSPHAPQLHSALPSGVTPAMGSRVPTRQWKFDFHGYMQVPLRGSIGTRERAYDGQQKTTLHGDPNVAGGSYGWFDHTLTVPTPWTQLNFLYGNEDVQAVAIIGAWSLSEPERSAGSNMPQAQEWINDAFLQFTPPVYGPIELAVKVGSYSDRYGSMAQYSDGVYGVALMGQVKGIGTTATLTVPFEWDLTGRLEAGFKGQLGAPPPQMVPEGSNEHARLEEGSTWAAHGHASLSYADVVFPTLHYIRSWSQDDRNDPRDDPGSDFNETQSQPDGSLSVTGADIRVSGGRFGHFYLGGSRIHGEDALSVSSLVNILNTGGGKDIMERYWGFESGGTGDLYLAGVQYTLSLGTLLRYPTEFWGEGPDLFLTPFGIWGFAKSPARNLEEDGSKLRKKMVKYGGEITYSFAKYMAVSGRFDHVKPDMDDPSRSFAVFSPKVVFRTDWKTREALTVQYATYFLGSNVRVEGDERLMDNPSGKPDKHLLAVYGTMWW